jgi:lipid II:glycine glycyltransferase (peptidoglycan interpeptide bridge formation enzyme)
MSVTGERDAFAVHSPAYYYQAYDSLTPGDRARLLIASYGGQPLAALLVCACGDKAWYMYGASSDAHRERMPAYALQWAAMRWAKARGCTTYDLWGIPDVDEDTLEAQFTTRSDGLWGVYRHKRGYGGEVVRYARAFDRVCSRPGHWVYRLGLRLRGGM